MSDMEFGKCKVCGKETSLMRTYYRYDIKCECHSPQHFEFVSHCKDCEPKEPTETTMVIRSDSLKRKLTDN